MGQKPTETGPIEEESSVTRQCLEVAILHLNQFRNELEDRQGHDEPALKEIMATLRDAYTALNTEVIENPVFTVAGILEDLYAVKIDEEPYCDRCGHYTTNGDGPCDCNDGSCEGEMQAEAEAERQADAALELSAELASCDWESWE